MSLPRFYIIVLMLYLVVYKAPHIRPYQYFSIRIRIIHLCLFLIYEIDGSNCKFVYIAKIYNGFTLGQELFWTLVIEQVRKLTKRPTIMDLIFSCEETGHGL